MAFPAVSGTPAEGAVTSAGTSHAVTFTQTTGHLVVIVIATAVTVEVVSTDEVFTNLFPTVGNTHRLHIFYRYLTGSEGGTHTFTTASTKSAWISFNITGADTVLTPMVGTVATATSNAPDSPSLSPTGGSKDYLWIACFQQNGEEDDDNTWQNNTPTGTGGGSYSPALGYQKTTGIASAATTNTQVCAAYRQYTGATEDPSAWSTDQSLAWRAQTIAIYPETLITISAQSIPLAGSVPSSTITAPGTATINTAAISLAGSIPSSVVTVPGVATVTTTALPLTGSILSSVITTPGIATVNAAAISLAGSIPSSIITVPGTATITLDDLSLVSTINNIAIWITETISLNSLSLASSVENSVITTPGIATITLSNISLIGSIPSSSITVPGVATMTLSELTAALAIQNTIVSVPGVASIPLNSLSLSSIVGNITIVPIGTVTINLNGLSLISSIESVMVTPLGTATVTLSALSIGSAVYTITIEIGGGELVEISLDQLDLTSSINNLIVSVPGTATIQLTGLIASLSLEDISVVGVGSTIISLDELSLIADCRNIAIYSVGTAIIGLNTLDLISSVETITVALTYLPLSERLPATTEAIMPIGDISKEWNIAVPNSDHFSNINTGVEGPSAPDDASYNMTNAANKTDSYVLSAGMSGKTRIDEFTWQFRYAGEVINKAPGLTIELWVKGILRATSSVDVSTNGLTDYVNGQVSWTGLNISGIDWYDGPRIIKHISTWNVPHELDEPEVYYVPVE